MKILKMKKLLLLLLIIVFVLQSCENKTEKKITKNIQQTTKVTKNDSINSSVSNPKIFTDNFEFICYDDNGDYMLLNAKKGNEIYNFFNDSNKERNLLRGDICKIHWEKDTIEIDGEKQIEHWISNVKKIQDGNVAKFRKKYKKKLKYHWHEDNNYSQNYLDEIYLVAEYYIANSKNELIRQTIKDKNQIEYSIEKRTENNRDYDLLGIGYMFEHRFTVMQWIYIENVNYRIFEYDLPNEKLTEFE